MREHPTPLLRAPGALIIVAAAPLALSISVAAGGHGRAAPAQWKAVASNALRLRLQEPRRRSAVAILSDGTGGISDGVATVAVDENGRAG